MTHRPWYRRFPDNFITGTVALTLEEKGAYNVVIDMIYARGGPVPDEPRHIAGICNCSVRKWNAIRQRLLEMGKLVLVEGHLSNPRADEELENAAKTARELAENGAKGGNKSAENKATYKKNNGLGQAPLKHTRASLHQHQLKKSDASLLVPTESAVQLDRYRDEALFKACERVTGTTVPEYMQFHTWPREIVDQAAKSS